MHRDEQMEGAEDKEFQENPENAWHPQGSETTSGAEVNRTDLSLLTDAASRIRGELSRVIVGQEDTLELLLASLFAGGHVLLEGVPGIAKTLIAKLLAQTLDLDFSRIQFTPDLMPSDVIGTTVFNVKNSDFFFNRGPVFANVVLIDEINRAPAKTQAALFEVMEEHQVTVDGETYSMDFPFFVIATQNPIEQEGTYKLPEAQLDRFLMKITLDYPSLAEERSILRRFRNDFRIDVEEEVAKVFSPNEVAATQALVEQIYIKDELLDYIAELVHETRHNPDLFLGASPRASLAILRSAKALAALRGRDFVIPEDIHSAALPALNHRLLLTPEREMDGYTAGDVIEEILEKVEVPR